MTATLFLIPSPLGEALDQDSFPRYIKTIIEQTDHFIVENEKEARRFIKKIAPEKTQSNIRLYPLNKHTSAEDIETYLDPCLAGNNMGLISDAGCPGVADPGAIMIQKANRLEIKVKPLVGPSSILLAMMGSGLNGQNFAFNGYLPIDRTERKKVLKVLENRSLKLDQSQIFMETPYRNEKLLEDLKQVLHTETQLCIAFQLTQADEFIKTRNIGLWKKTKISFHKKPAIFIIHKTN
jgi:16S rRNA (cytidine1402-2'-O)-methyltransferase